MMSAQPAGPTFREGDEVVLAKGSYQGTRFPQPERGYQLGRHPRAQWCHPQPSSDVASSFRDHDPSFHKLTPP